MEERVMLDKYRICLYFLCLVLVIIHLSIYKLDLAFKGVPSISTSVFERKDLYLDIDSSKGERFHKEFYSFINNYIAHVTYYVEVV